MSEVEIRNTSAGVVVMRLLAFILASYLYCAVLDPFFFDYPVLVLIPRQVFGMLLAAGVLLVCVRWRWIGLFVFVLCGLFFCGLHYAYVEYGYEVGFELMSAIFQTNAHELGGFINFSFYVALAIAVCALSLVFVLAVYALGWKPFSWGYALQVFLVILVWCGIYIIPDLTIGQRYGFYRKMADNTLRNDRELFIAGHRDVAVRRWCLPYSNLPALVGGVKEYFREVNIKDAALFPSIDTREGEDLVFVLVFGESVRADHVPAGGYHRNTMPHVTAEPGVCFYTRMYSYASSTYDSVAAMLSGVIGPGEKEKVSSYAGILKKHGFEGRLYSENTMNITDSKRFHMLLGQYMQSCNACRAPIMDVCKTIVDDIQKCNAGRQLVVVENGTGHFPFINEDKYDVYKPCNMDWMAALPDNKKEVLTNDYDNCIVSVDKFLAGLIDGVRERNAVLLYVSDHGQLLYENGKLMHGDPHNVLLRQPAAFVWFSDEYRRRYPELVAEMEAVRDKPLVHGQVYATILGLCGIKSDVPLSIGDFVNDDVRNHQHNVPSELISADKAEK